VQPASVLQEQLERLQRTAQGQRREGSGGIVLTRVREVRERRRCRGQHQPNHKPKGHEAEANEDGLENPTCGTDRASARRVNLSRQDAYRTSGSACALG
jgi:hypothetical protein